MEGTFVKIDRKILKWEWFDDPYMFKLFVYLLLKANHTDGRWQGFPVKRGQLITGRIKLASDLRFSEMKVRNLLNKLIVTKEITSKTTNKYTVITICKYDTYQSNNFEYNQQSNQQTTNKKVGKNVKNEKSLFLNNQQDNQQNNQQETVYNYTDNHSYIYNKSEQNNQQNDQQTTNKLSNKQPTNNQQATTSKNDKNDKNDKNEYNAREILKNSNLFREPNIPNFEDVHRVFLQNGGTEQMAKTFFEKNEGVNWFFKGSPITNFSKLVPSYVDSWKKNDKNGKKLENKGFNEVPEGIDYDNLKLR